MRHFRARAWCLFTAAVLALGTTATSLSEVLHAAAPHDLACAPALDLSHDPSSHQIESPHAADASAHHCVGCHLARTPRLGAQAATHVGHTGSGISLRPAAAIGSARAAALDLLPPRSPPRLA